MSTLAADTITNVAGSSAGTTITIDKDSTYNSEGAAVTQNLVQGLAKVWVNYQQNTPAVRDSINVSGVTDTATGRYAVAYTNNMGNALYSALCNSINFHNHVENASGANSEASMTTGDCDFMGQDSSNTNADSALTSIGIFGDLA
jgi:hypothetical protein